MEGSQALSSMDTKSPKVLSTSHGRDHLLFIAPQAKIAITPSLSVFWDDWTRRSCALDASGGDRMRLVTYVRSLPDRHMSHLN